ncbi:hypothetical protein CU103_24980 [Phyllobacterium sophorae]|uniref:Uncharacterized protein n=1 Tax=Phyllobacterium sophorae TaxID=1520277 RepID=A0A2P7B2X6_9HYPH|nr:hypothetical protein CU103_24980 [Phyllobacterium sophorae]
MPAIAAGKRAILVDRAAFAALPIPLNSTALAGGTLHGYRIVLQLYATGFDAAAVYYGHVDLLS